MANRQFLLSNYFQQNPIWVALAEQLDNVWAENIDTFIVELTGSRNLLPVTGTESKAQLQSLFNSVNIDTTLLGRNSQQLGFNFGGLSAQSYYILSLFLGTYYEQKGTQAFADFFSFALNSPVSVEPLWTEDYVNFGVYDPSTMTPIWEGGTYYPTGKVLVTIDQTFAEGTFIDLFNHIAPIHLIPTFQFNLPPIPCNMGIIVLGEMTVIFGPPIITTTSVQTRFNFNYGASIQIKTDV